MTPPGARISVVVATCNRAERLMRLLDALSIQDLAEPFEVVVVDDRSTDDTLARLNATAGERPFTLLIVPSVVNTGAGGARNRGWQAARGEVVAFTDDDCVPDPAWLRCLTDGLVEADITIGRTRPPEDQLHLIGPLSHYLDIDHNQSFSTCNIAYRRTVLEKMDGFDADGYAWVDGEDTDLGLRAVKDGFRDAYVEDALVWHDVGPSAFKPHMRRLRRLKGIVALVAQHPESRQNLNATTFLRSVDKAVLLSWAATGALVLRPRSKATRLFALVAVALYLWQHDKSHYKARSVGEWATTLPQSYVADNWAVMIMIRNSVRYRTLLL